MYLIWRIRGRKVKNPALPPRWGVLLGLAYLAGLSHILLDFTNNYGIRPFWPFSERWYSWDIVFIVEPVILVLLVGALLLPSLASLISEEIGARSSGPKGKLAATDSFDRGSFALGRKRLRTSGGGVCLADEHLSRCNSHSDFGVSLLVEYISLVRSGGDYQFLCRHAIEIRRRLIRSGISNASSLQAGRDSGHAGSQTVVPRESLPRLGQISGNGNGTGYRPCPAMWSGSETCALTIRR